MRVGGDIGTCTDAPDFESSTGVNGVDDQATTALTIAAQTAVSASWDALVADSIEAGAFVLVLEVSDGGDACARTVHAYVARTSSGAAPDASTVCPTRRDESACKDGCYWHGDRAQCAGIAAGQSWTVVEDLGEAPASLFAGRLRTAPFARIPLRPAPRGVVAPIDARGAVIEAEEHGGLLRGEMGGAMRADEMLAWYNAHVGSSPTVDRATFDLLVAPDLAPDGAGVCQDVSAGFELTAIEATLVR
jgi:hypothetical protein